MDHIVNDAERLMYEISRGELNKWTAWLLALCNLAKHGLHLILQPGRVLSSVRKAC